MSLGGEDEISKLVLDEGPGDQVPAVLLLLLLFLLQFLSDLLRIQRGDILLNHRLVQQEVTVLRREAGAEGRTSGVQSDSVEFAESPVLGRQGTHSEPVRSGAAWWVGFSAGLGFRREFRPGGFRLPLPSHSETAWWVAFSAVLGLRGRGRFRVPLARHAASLSR
jgi:hypothetical protein